MKMTKNYILTIVSLLIFFITACNNKEEQGVTAPLGNEFLTTTILNLQNLSIPSDKSTISYKLIGTNPAVISPDTLILHKNSSYSCAVVILDETKNPEDTVSIVIKERANYHLFFFRPTPELDLADSITDRDTNIPPLPVGLQSIIKTMNISTGTLEVILRHQPNVKNGTYPPGSTDLDVFYPVKIE
jgi:hypothetical protein